MDIIQKLPEDIMKYIIPYTYSPQPAHLLKDIRNYVSTRQLIKDIYYNNWIKKWGEEQQEDQNWLINDLFGFGNNGMPTMISYIDDFRNLWFRNPQININDDFDRFIIAFNKKQVSTQINMFWGIMTMSERKEFINETLIQFADPSIIHNMNIEMPELIPIHDDLIPIQNFPDHGPFMTMELFT
ncbi:MAG: hypothetical protein CMF69_11390 [Magnetovibrio sp.]|nr:hypothetical protein [Magnetovibrio sp.]